MGVLLVTNVVIADFAEELIRMGDGGQGVSLWRYEVIQACSNLVGSIKITAQGGAVY